jgi:hypothetical protein
VTAAEEKVQLDLPSSWITTALGIGVVGLVGCALAGLANPALFFRAYLVAFAPCLAICLGCLVLGMVGYLTTASWGFAFTPVFESATKVLPLLVLLYLPLLLGLDKLYPWASADDTNPNPLYQYKKDYYLNPQFFIARAFFYLAVWNLVAWVLRYLARRAGETGAIEDSRTLRRFCGFGLVVYGATFTFAAVDWFMSLEPEWWSAIYAVMLAIGQLLTAYAFSVIVFVSLVLRAPAVAPTDGQPAPKHGHHFSQQLLRDFGNLMLAFTMIWTYMSFSQYLLVYSGNLKDEVTWYMPRTHNGWEYVVMTLAVTQFGLPFFLLLNKELKRNPRTLLGIACLIFASRFLDITWLLAPTAPGDQLPLLWLLPLAFAGLGGIWAALFLYQLRRRILVLKLAGLDAEALLHE